MPDVDGIELQGPAEPTLEIPRRRSGTVTLLAVTAVSIVVLLGGVLLRPEVVSIVQAFVGDF